jgi:Rhs element Vgr protein
MSIVADPHNRPLYLFPQSAMDKPEDPVEKLWLDVNHFRVFRVELREELCRPFRAEFDVWASEELLQSTPCPAWIWKSFDLFLETGAETVPEGPTISRRLRGLVTRISNRKQLRIGGRNGSVLRLVLEPDLVALLYQIRSRVHGGRLSIIISEILRGEEAKRERDGAKTSHLAIPCVINLSSDEPELFQKTQYEESDLAFLMRLAEEYGLAWYCDWEQDPPVWVFTDKTPDLYILDRSPNLRTVPFIQKVDEEISPPPDMVHEFSMEYSAYVEKFTSYSLNPYDGSACQSELAANKLPGVQLEAHKIAHGFHFHGEIPGQGELDWLHEENSTLWKSVQNAAMKREAARSASAGVGGNMTGSLGHPFPGWVFGLDGAEPNLKYLVTSSRMAASYYPQSTSGDLANEEWFFSKNSMFGVRPADCRFVPARVTPVPKIFGVRLARVVGYQEGQENQPVLGRCGSILVRMDWLGYREEKNRRLARVCQPWAGDGYGTMFWPRVGNEVAVAFEQGDPDRPVVVGSLYSAWNRPPESVDCIPFGWVSGIVSQPRIQGDVGHGKNNFIKIFDDQNCQVSIHSVTTPFEVSSLNSFKIVKGGQVNIMGWPF